MIVNVFQWTLVCKQNFVSDLITTVQMVGLLIGAGLFGQVSDVIGRKKTYFMVFTIMILFGFVSAFANSWQLYAACRAIVGVGFGGLMVVACVYPIEFVGKRWRVFCGTIGFWALGTMLLALLVRQTSVFRTREESNPHSIFQGIISNILQTKLILTL